MVTEQYSLSVVAEGWFVSSAILGCIGGVSLAGKLSDQFGRKKILILASILFIISAIGCSLSISEMDLIIYRFVGGLGVGMASMLSPMYISEISPPAVRGRLVALYQFAITIGILCAYFSNSQILQYSENHLYNNTLWSRLYVDEIWRGMFAIETIPALSFFILLFFIPESPRWLSKQLKEDKAYSILNKISGPVIAKNELSDIKNVLSHKKVSLKKLFQPGLRTAMIIGIVLAVLSQFSGINAIIYFGPTILSEAGFTIGQAFGGQVTIGIVNVMFTIITILYIDKFGRKPLLIYGISGLVFSLIVIGFLFFINITSGILILIFILLFIACFAVSFGGVTWVLLSEIYPTNIRGRAMSVAIMSLWSGTALVGQFVPWLLENITTAGTFWLFALLCFPAIIVTWKMVPETKGKSLEEIEKYWRKK